MFSIDRQKRCNDFWTSIKNESSISELVENKLFELQQSQAKSQPSITSFFALPRPHSTAPKPTIQSQPPPSPPPLLLPTEVETQSEQGHSQPKQEQLQAQIAEHFC